MPRCVGVKADGEPCKAIVKEGQRICAAHDPARAEQRRRAASKAGSWTKSTPELAGLKKELRQLADDIRAGRVTTGKGSVINQVLGSYLKVVEQERKQREQEQLVTELAELREIVSRQEGQSWAG
jgi:hypothetical protein